VKIMAWRSYMILKNNNMTINNIICDNGVIMKIIVGYGVMYNDEGEMNR